MINKKENENYLEFADRITQKLLYGSIGYKEWSESLIGDVIYSEENLRRCSVFLNMFLEKIKEDGISSFDENLISNFQNIKEDIITERNKLQQEKIELNEKYRWQARNELYQERIINAIEKLPSFGKPLYLYTVKNENKVGSTALLCLSDFHAGSTYEIKGLYGEVVNKYNFEIMEQRLLSKLREPVVDTVIKFSEFISEWLVELYKIVKVPINVVTVGGNHDINRILNQKPQLEEENLTKLVVEFLKLRLKDFSEITIDDYTDVAVKNIKNTNIMFQHGEDKDIELTMNYFENLYNITVDEIICGHLHRPESKSVGISDVGDKTIMRVGSICGIDPFAKKVRCAARPSCYFALYDEENGKTWSRNYYL